MLSEDLQFIWFGRVCLRQQYVKLAWLLYIKMKHRREVNEARQNIILTMFSLVAN